MAALAVIAGLPADEAVVWARRHHHPRAVETPWQRRWVERVLPRALDRDTSERDAPDEASP